MKKAPSKKSAKVEQKQNATKPKKSTKSRNKKGAIHKRKKSKKKESAAEIKRKKELKSYRIAASYQKRKYIGQLLDGESTHETYSYLMKLNRKIADLSKRDEKNVNIGRRKGWHLQGGWWVATAVSDFWNWFKLNKRRLKIINDWEVPESLPEVIAFVDDLILSAGNYDRIWIKYNIELKEAIIYIQEDEDAAEKGASKRR